MGQILTFTFSGQRRALAGGGRLWSHEDERLVAQAVPFTYLPGPAHRRAVRGDDDTGEPVLHVPPQRLVDRQLGRFGTAGGAVGAIARSWPGMPDRRCAWRRCGAARGRSWTARASRRAISRTPCRCARQIAISSRWQTTESALTAASPPARDAMVACRPPSGTTVPPRPAIPRPQRPHPHSSVPPRSTPRTGADPHAVPPRAGQATATRLAATDPNAASERPSQPPLSRCCDDRLNPGCTPCRYDARDRHPGQGAARAGPAQARRARSRRAPSGSPASRRCDGHKHRSQRQHRRSVKGAGGGEGIQEDSRCQRSRWG